VTCDRLAFTVYFGSLAKLLFHCSRSTQLPNFVRIRPGFLNYSADKRTWIKRRPPSQPAAAVVHQPKRILTNLSLLRGWIRPCNCLHWQQYAVGDGRLRPRCRHLAIATKQHCLTSDWCRCLANWAKHTRQPIVSIIWKGNVTLSTKPEVHNISLCRQKVTEPRPQIACRPTENLVKLGRMIFEICERTDKQKNRQTDRQTNKQPAAKWQCCGRVMSTEVHPRLRCRRGRGWRSVDTAVTEVWEWTTTRRPWAGLVDGRHSSTYRWGST